MTRLGRALRRYVADLVVRAAVADALDDVEARIRRLPQSYVIKRKSVHDAIAAVRADHVGPS
jgi:hypothetical protein